MSNLHYLRLALDHAKKTRDFLFDLVFPVECLNCGIEGDWLCLRCFRTLDITRPQYCLACKRPDAYGRFCAACLNRYHLEGVWIAGDYDNKLLAGLVKSMKYRLVRDVSLSLGEFLSLFIRNLRNRGGLRTLIHTDNTDIPASYTPEGLPPSLRAFDIPLLVPVPLHRRRLNWRGFNQAEAVAQALAGRTGLELSLNELVRVRHKKPQASLGEKEREANIRGCYDWRGRKLDGRPIILLDDVVTTGATLNECARMLKYNGAGEVWGLVVAKG